MISPQIYLHNNDTIDTEHIYNIITLTYIRRHTNYNTITVQLQQCSTYLRKARYVNFI